MAIWKRIDGRSADRRCPKCRRKLSRERCLACYIQGEEDEEASSLMDEEVSWTEMMEGKEVEGEMEVQGLWGTPRERVGLQEVQYIKCFKCQKYGVNSWGGRVCEACLDEIGEQKRREEELEEHSHLFGCSLDELRLMCITEEELEAVFLLIGGLNLEQVMGCMDIKYGYLISLLRGIANRYEE